MIGQVQTGKCNRCTGDCDHTALHMFYQCESIKPLFLWLLRVLFDICNFRPNSNINFLYFDVKYGNLYQKTVCNIFLYIYIITIWKTRKENLRIGILRTLILNRVLEHFKFINHLPNHKIGNICEDMKRLDMDKLINI